MISTRTLSLPNSPVSYRNEVYRKLLHIAFGLVTVGYLLFSDRTPILWILGVLAGVAVAGEAMRLRFSIINRLFKLMFGAVVRVEEHTRFTGVTATVVGAFLTVFIFEKNVAVFGLLVMTLADSAAALVGKKWGKRPFLEKTVEGSVTFLIIAFLLAMFLPGLPRIGAAAGAVVATVVEVLPSRVNDNLLIPLATGITVSLVYLIP